MNLSDDDIEEALFCVNEVIGWRQRYCQPVPSWMIRLARRFNIESLMSASGHESASEEIGLELENILVGSSEAAEILGLSPRHLGRLAQQLEGEKIGNRWVFKLSTVTEYAKDKHHG